MKKTLAFVLGLILLSGIVMPFSQASRDAYHVYLTSRQNKQTLRSTRYFTDRQGVINRFSQSKTKKPRSGRRAIRNLRFPKTGKRYIYSGSARGRSTRISRPSTQARISGWQNRLSTRKANVKVSGLMNLSFETYENEAFSVQIPEGWFNESETDHLFVSPESDFSVRIKKFEENPCEQAEGFTMCAIDLSKNENREAIGGRGKLLNTSRIIRQSQHSDTVLNSINVRTATYTENFNAHFGSEEKHVSRYFVRDLDGGVYLIETQTTPQKARQYVGVSKQIFDSFRIYPEQ